MTTPPGKGLRQEALDYHAQAPAGKLAIAATKPLLSPRDLSLAYSPGVAEPCREIFANRRFGPTTTPLAATSLPWSRTEPRFWDSGDGPRAAKPVMEGKAVLFKRFADIDVFDLELDAKDPQLFIQVVKKPWSPRLVESTSKTSRHQNASKSSANCARSEDPRLPRRPAWHCYHRGRRPWSVPWRSRAGHWRGSTTLLRVRAPRRWRA